MKMNGSILYNVGGFSSCLSLIGYGRHFKADDWANNYWVKKSFQGSRKNKFKGACSACEKKFLDQNSYKTVFQ